MPAQIKQLTENPDTFMCTMCRNILQPNELDRVCKECEHLHKPDPLDDVPAGDID